jgi:hypothetical protein
MPRIRYEGPCPRVEIVGYGHFSPGDEKAIDTITGYNYLCPACVEAGWVVIPDAATSATDVPTPDGVVEATPAVSDNSVW